MSATAIITLVLSLLGQLLPLLQQLQAGSVPVDTTVSLVLSPEDQATLNALLGQ